MTINMTTTIIIIVIIHIIIYGRIETKSILNRKSIHKNIASNEV